MRPLYIGGATGAGKSAVAIAIAETLGGEIVNADAYQLYSGIEIVTAAPSAADRERVPHHLFGCLRTDEDCNAGRFANLATPVIDSLLRRGKLPVVVGGSGLYLKSLTHGLSDLPPADAALRSQLDALSAEALNEELRRVDPAAATKIDAQNRRYVTRAVEISMLAGRPMSELKTDWENAAPDFDGVLIERPRDELYARINDRVPRMVEAGLLDEIRSLPPELSATAEKAIGVREVRAHLAGAQPLGDCVAAIQQASRRFAKRQLTWFRRETAFQRVCLEAADTAESAARRALSHFPNLLNNA